MTSEHPEILYHYCPLESFLKIIESSQIRLSDIRKSNDSLEFRWILQKCKQLIDDTIIGIISKITILESEGKATKRQLEYRSALHEITSEVERVFEEREKNSVRTAWVICFSSKPDSLDQWRGYANDGNGVALGFRREYLEIFKKAAIPVATELTCDLSSIMYNLSNEDYKILLRIADIDIETEPNEANARFKASLSRACDFPPIYKNPSFEEEQEWRIYFHSQLSKNILYNESVVTSNPSIFQGRFEMRNRGFYVRENRIVSFIPLFIPSLKDAVSKIIIGPKADISKLDIEKMLIQYGHYNQPDACPITIIRSSSSYN